MTQSKNQGSQRIYKNSPKPSSRHILTLTDKHWR